MELNFNPKKLKRELKKYYISLSESEIEKMLSTINLSTDLSLSDLFQHIPPAFRMGEEFNIGERLEYFDLVQHLVDLSDKNQTKTSFIGDGLKHFAIPNVVAEISNIRGLSTAYTPYQPERGQGTLMSLWIYSSCLSMLTGFEAVNSSFYERATCLLEALNTCQRLMKKNTVIVCQSIYPGDQEVLISLARHTNLKIIWAPLDETTGLTDHHELNKLIVLNKDDLAGISFPQINSLGNLEDVNVLTDLARQHNIKSVSIIDPMTIATDGLLPPAQFGSKADGTDMFVAEGQHLCLEPNGGGPGLGIFGIRFNNKNRSSIRLSAGRFVGDARDIEGNPCKTQVLATREQHIRREKATSNICSNQAFIATLAGASILSRGEKGMTKALTVAQQNALRVAEKLRFINGVSLAFPTTPFFHEFVIDTPLPAEELINRANKAGIEIGVDVSKRTGDQHHLLMSFSDIHQQEDVDKLINFISKEFSSELSSTDSSNFDLPPIPLAYKRRDSVGLPDFSPKEILDYYKDLGSQNVSPDQFIYPLGSCTMKYNPYINDFAANLPKFRKVHPQAPIENMQGHLTILYSLQEMFKSITGMYAITTQPVAGAQGELVGLKIIQAYHREQKRSSLRNIILIPRSAHGTNPASAATANFKIMTIEALPSGTIDFESLKEVVQKHASNIAGIMVTNPNTSGIFEKDFKAISDLIHQVGGLVYMDGANMNAIAGQVNLQKLGVDIVHNNLHKTWSISHGGGGPGDAIVAVVKKLEDYLPGKIVVKSDEQFYSLSTPLKSIGSCHRHLGNMAHKIRCYTYLKALGTDGVKQMSSCAVLSARYLYQKLIKTYPTLPAQNYFEKENPIMHEFILTLDKECFENIAQKCKLGKPQIMGRVGKLFLDFGLHAPTISFPEPYGFMVEPTESFSLEELDRFVQIYQAVSQILTETPEILTTVPHFTPVARIDEVSANKNLKFSEKQQKLAPVQLDKVATSNLAKLSVDEIYEKILCAHRSRLS